MGNEVVFGVRIKGDNKEAVSIVRETRTELERLNATSGSTAEKIKAQNAAFASTSVEVRKAAIVERQLSDEHIKLDAAITRLRSSIDPAFASMRKLDQANELLHAGMRNGVITQSEYKRSLDLLGKKFEETGEHLNAGVTREVIVLGHEMVSGNFSRIPGSLMVLTSRMGGVGMAAIGMTAAVAAPIAILGMAAIRAEEYTRQLVSLERQFVASGQASVVASGQLRQQVDELALMPGVSREAAEQTAASFAHVPQVGQQMFGKLMHMTADFAAAMGTDIPKAGQALAESFAHPAEGAKKLNAELNFLSGDQLLLIERLERQGKIMEAMQVLYDALHKRVSGLHTQGITPLQASTDALSRSWETMLQKIGKSEALETVTNSLGKIVHHMTWMLDHGEEVAAVIAAGIPGIGPTVAAGAYFAGDSSGGKGKFGGKGTSGSWSDAPAGDTSSRGDALLALAMGDAGGFASAKRQIGELKDRAVEFKSAMDELAARGQKGSEQYKLFADSLSEVKKRIKDLSRKDDSDQRQLLQARAEGEYKIAEIVSKGQTQQTESLFKIGAIGEKERQARHLSEDLSLLNARKIEQQQLAAISGLKPAELAKHQQEIAAIDAEIAARQKLDQFNSSELEETRKREAAKQLADEAERINKAREATIAYRESLQNVIDTRQQAIDISVMAISTSDKEIERQRRMNDVLKDYDTRYSALVKSRSTGSISQDQFEQQLVALKDYEDRRVALELEANNRLEAAMSDWHNGAQRALENYLDDIKNVAGQTEKLFSDSFKGAEDALAEFYKTGKLNGDSFFKALEDNLAHMLAKQTMAPITGAIESMSGNLGSWFSGLFNANGNAFTSGGMHAFANGGAFGDGAVLTKPTLFRFAAGGSFASGVAGEAGPEGALPLKRMSNGKLGVYADGGGMNVIVNLIESPGNGGKVEQRADGSGGMTIDIMVEQIESRMSRNINRGGGIAPTLENRYGLNSAARSI